MNASVPQSALAKMDQPSTAVSMGFANAGSFDLMQRAARLLSASTLVPAQYRQFNEKKRGNEVDIIENPSALSNCVVALNMSQRMGADPLMVMQNLYIVEGRPSWSSQWIIAAINGCGRFSPLRFDLKDLGDKEVEYSVTEWVDRQRVNKKLKTTVRNLECIAWAIEKETGARIDSPRVSIEMAVKEGWYGKSGSKWQTMPEVMLRYRTASFFGKLYAPELLMGMQSVEETHDTLQLDPDGSVYVPGKPEVAMPRQLDPAPAAPSTAAAAADPATGEILQPAPAPVINPADNPETGRDPEPAPAPAADPKPAARSAPAGDPGALATDGERKFVLNRAKSAGLEVAALVEQAGLAGLPADLAGLTKDGFVALRDLLPKAA